MSMEGKQTVHIEEITDNQVLDSSLQIGVQRRENPTEGQLLY